MRGVLWLIICGGGSFYNWNDVVERREYCGENWCCPWNDVVERLLWKVWLKSSPVRDNLGWKRPMGLQPPHLFISINRTNTNTKYINKHKWKWYRKTNQAMELQPPHRTNTKYIDNIYTITHKYKWAHGTTTATPLYLDQQNKYKYKMHKQAQMKMA